VTNYQDGASRFHGSQEKDLISVSGKPSAAFVCPGHPRLDATIDLVQDQYRDLLKRVAILVDPSDPGGGLRALLYLEHAISNLAKLTTRVEAPV
jgi:hypothetical protein